MTLTVYCVASIRPRGTPGPGVGTPCARPTAGREAASTQAPATNLREWCTMVLLGVRWDVHAQRDRLGATLHPPQVERSPTLVTETAGSRRSPRAGRPGAAS